MRDYPIEKYVKGVEWIRNELILMDSCNPVMGIRDWDDCVIVKFGNKKLVVSVDGPYTKRLVLKSALIHAATDVVVKGAKPIFALDALIGGTVDLKDMIASLKKQACAVSIPILGGNTLVDECEPRCSLTIVGELLLTNPIRDRTARKGDVVALVGEPIWGGIDERIVKAKKLFKTWFKVIKKVKINSSKDVTKGGLMATIYEMESKSKRKFVLNENLPFPLSRNLDNFLITLRPVEYRKLESICLKEKCPVYKIGLVS